MGASERSCVNQAKVLVVDDHPVVRDGLARMIGEQEDLTVCGGVGSCRQALLTIGQLKPDVVIVDISLQDGSGLELIKDITTRYDHLPVLVLSMHDETLYAERALAAGARGYIMKEVATETVVAAIRRVLEGGIWVSDEVSTRLLGTLVRGRDLGRRGPLERLSDRELEVFEFIGRALATCEIAAKLHLSIRTIDSYCAKIKQKLHLKNAKELLRYAVQWVETTPANRSSGHHRADHGSSGEAPR